MKQPAYRRLASLVVLTLCNSYNQGQISYIARFNQHNPKGDCWLKSRRDLFTLLNCADFLSVVGICWCFTFLFLSLDVCVYIYYFVEFVDVLKNLTFLFALFGFLLFSCFVVFVVFFRLIRFYWVEQTLQWTREVGSLSLAFLPSPLNLAFGCLGR